MRGPPLSLHDTTIGLRLPREVKERAQQAAAAAGWDLSTWLRVIVEIAATAELEAAAERHSSPPPSKPSKTFLRRRPGT